jgi:hypothetical protein
MRRNCLHLSPLISILLLFSALAYGQSWSGVLAPSRAFDWSNAGLPGTLPDGEKTPNPWTPPTRTQCVTTQCNVVAGGNVTATTISAAIASAPQATYVQIPAGTFALGGNVNVSANNVTLRGSGASATKLTGGSIAVGNGAWVGASLLTANPAKGAMSVTVASPPTGGRLVALEQCDDGFSATNANFTHFGSGVVCTGSYSDPHGPWVCGLNSACDANGGGTPNPHFQMDVLWLPAGGVSGNTVTFASPLANDNWSTARTAALMWFTSSTVGVGIEALTIEDPISFTGTYSCWIKGVRLVETTSATLLYFHADSHSLVANSYIANTVDGINYLAQFGYDGGEQGQSHFLFINNIVEGGWFAGFGDQVDHVYAYNYAYTANPGWVSNGNFQHHAGTSFLLNEGNQAGKSLDDETWGTHNFNTWFRNYYNCKDPVFPTLGNTPTIGIQGYARFENVIGNALGGGVCSAQYQARYGVFDINNTGLDTTGLTQASTMRWGNYAICSDGNSHCNKSNFDSAEVPANLSSFGANSTPYQNSVPGSNNLPASFFMNGMTAHPSGGTGLSWWKACTGWTSFPTTCGSSSTPPMPPIGPDVTGGPNANGHAYNIPAALAWASLPVDPNYPTSWGNIRQFDERVYQADGSAGSGGGGSSGNPPPAPTGLNAVVQ